MIEPKETTSQLYLREHREWSQHLRSLKPWHPPRGLTRYIWRNIHGLRRSPSDEIPTPHALWVLAYLGRRARWLRANGRRNGWRDRKAVGALLDILAARGIRPTAEDCAVYWDKLCALGRSEEGGTPFTLLEVWALSRLAAA